MNIKKRCNLSTVWLVLLAIFGLTTIQTSAANGRLGELDPTFNPVALNSSVNNNLASANAVTVQPDGKILYAGNFLAVDRLSRNFIVRFNADGTVDTSFDSGGTVDNVISSIALQSDGKIVVVGNFTMVAGQTRNGIARLNADGSFDATFNSSFTSSNSGVAVQTDGKILVSGVNVSGNLKIVRLNVDGSNDTSFSSPNYCVGNRIVVQTDGKIINNSSCQLSTLNTINISRLNANGTVDTTFTPGTGADTRAIEALVLQNDGKILVGGQFTTFNGQTRKGFTRLNANGSLDTAFNPAMPQFFQSQAIAIQPDGKILAAQKLDSIGSADNSVLRINTDGTFDTAFNNPPSAYIYAIAVAPDGRIYEGGQMATFQNSVLIQKPFLRVNSDGSIDYAFDPFVAAPDDSALMYNIVPQPDGKIFVSGAFVSLNRQNRAPLGRLNADGSIDTSFVLPANFSPTVNAPVLQPDGKIIVSGSLTGGPSFTIIRLNANGSLDTSFNLAGGANGNQAKIALQPDGKIVVAGNFSVIGGQSRNLAARLNTDGSVDAFQPNFGSSFVPFNSLLVQPDGKILLTGGFSSVNGTTRTGNVRFNADGTIDTTFVNTNLNFGPYLAIQTDGKLIVSEGGFVVRVNANNTLDNSFTPLTVYVTTNNQGTVNTAAIQADGKILIGGNFHFNGSYTRILPNIARLNANGSIDETYINYGGAGGNFNASAGGGNIQQISLQADGKVLLAGFFRTFNNFGRFGLARLNQSVTQANRISDFDGDGRADYSFFRPSANSWFYLRSSNNSFSSLQFGLTSDKLASTDYDGDGKTDIAVWRESSGTFYIFNSATNSVRTEQFGLPGDKLAVGDWDGDGKADPATYRDSAVGSQSYFYYRGSLNNPNGNVTYLQWGATGDKPVSGDFDGDGKLDAAVYRGSNQTWYIRQSSNNQVVYQSFGLSTDTFVPADYDGDGKTDVAVYRSGVWYVRQSSDNLVKIVNWGLSSDKPVPADYDGDGKTDFAVYRNGVWYVIQSANGQIAYGNFGAAGDLPVAFANQ